MLMQYTSKVAQVLACMIEDTGTVTKLKAGEYEYKHRGKGGITTLLIFQTSPKQEPKAGDFIIQVSKDDIYFCPAKVFHAKYVTTGMQIL